VEKSRTIKRLITICFICLWILFRAAVKKVAIVRPSPQNKKEILLFHIDCEVAVPVQQKVVELFRRFGPPVRSAVKFILSAALPGSGAVIGLVDAVLNCAHEHGKDEYDFDSSRLPSASPEDLGCVEQILDKLRGDSQTRDLLERVAAQKDPGRQQQVLAEILQSSAASRTALGEFGNLARQTHDKVLEIHNKVQQLFDVVLQIVEDQKARTRASQTSEDFAIPDVLPIKKGQYDAQIMTSNPACLLLLVDQSRSMNRPFGRQPGVRKSDGVAVMLNSILDNLCLLGGKRERLYVGVIGYGSAVGSILEGPLASQELVSNTNLTENKLQILKVTVTRTKPDGTQVRKPKQVPVWIRPRADGKSTPMKEAFETAHGVADGFLRKHPNCFPPIILNFTDGDPNTGSPEAAAEALRRLPSMNGPPLLFNAHLSDNPHEPILFPRTRDVLPREDNLARRMFDMSSVLPDLLVQRARDQRYQVDRGARGFAFNGDLDAVSKVLEIGISGYQGGIEQGGIEDLVAGMRRE
jgi:hypothetical protein